MGVILNKTKKEELNSALELLNSFEINLLGYLEKSDDENKIINSLDSIYTRLNLPQIES